MTQNRVEAEILRLFAETLELGVTEVDTDLLESGTLDSLKFVGLLHQLEITFHIQFSVNDLDMETFRSVRRIAEFVTRRAQDAGDGTSE